MGATYSFLSVQCTLTGPGGVINLGNGAGAADEGISFAPTGEMDSMTVGADGSGMHSLHADRSGRVTVRLLKTSPTNRLLAAMYNFQRATPANHGQNIIALVDTVRGDTVSVQQAAFTKMPNLDFGREASMVEWEFSAVRIDIALGA